MYETVERQCDETQQEVIRQYHVNRSWDRDYQHRDCLKKSAKNNREKTGMNKCQEENVSYFKRYALFIVTSQQYKVQVKYTKSGP